MQLAFGLDLGTTSHSAIAVAPDGRVVARLTRPHGAHVSGLRSGRAEQRPDALRTSALTILRELTALAPGNPMCLGLTGQMHGALMVDARRRPLTNLITWQDRRATEPGPDGSVPLDEFRARCAARSDAMARTGCSPSASHTSAILFTLARTGEIPPNTERAAMLADWIAAELCDSPIVTDPTHAASAGVFDVVAGAWNDELIAASGLDRQLFPRIAGSGTPIGTIAPEIAAETGLPAGMPVCNAVGDNQASVLGSVPSAQPHLQINIGTSGQINWLAEGFARIHGMDTRPFPHGRFLMVGAGLSGGDAYAWVMRAARGWLEAFGAAVDDETLFERLNELAARIPPDCDGLVCEPLFRGTRREPHAKGSFRGITPDNFTPGHVARAVLRGIATGMHGFYDDASEARPTHLSRIVGSGNALRRNPLFAEIIADVFQREVWIAEHEEEAAYGAALLAGSNVGLWPDLAAAGANVRLRLAARSSSSARNPT